MHLTNKACAQIDLTLDAVIILIMSILKSKIIIIMMSIEFVVDLIRVGTAEYARCCHGRRN